ncbi:hypothetical protein V8C35DRAFT_288458 [Trichoderma chlorosporum]
MVSSSPEYSITKPGLHHHLRKREKPLRTYGRQISTPEAQSEPPLKRQRLSALQQQEEKSTSPVHGSDGVTKPNDGVTTASSESTSKQNSQSQSKSDTGTQSSKKGSILSYFKPAPQHPKDEAPTQSPDSQPEEPIAPQETPKKKYTARRKPRLLKIKAVTHESSDESSQESDSDDLQPHSTRQPPQKTASKTAQGTSSSTTSRSSSPERKKSARGPKSSAKTRAPSVQTTLNISAQAAFSECKICDTVWNPLYPDDVKFHNKTHKAMLRAQKRKLDDL